MPAPVRPRATTREIREANRFAILRSIYSLSSPTRHALAAQTGLSFATVSTVVNELLATGLLVEAGKETSAGGRPRVRLKLAADFGTLVGVDVAETYIKVDVYDASLQPVARSRRDVEGSSDPEDLVRQIAGAITDTLLSADSPPLKGSLGTAGCSPEASGRVNLGVGISLPGQVQAATGVSIFAPNWGWHDVPVEQLLRKHLPYALHIDNPLKAATVAELWFGRGRETGDLVTVNLGTGVGAGIAIDGQLVRGTSNNAGEWGHTTLVLNGRACRCGRHGCVEAYLGVLGLMATFEEQFGRRHRYLDPWLQTHFITAVEQGMRNDEAEAVWMIERFAYLLGQSLANLVNMINPSLVVLTSWVVEQLGHWLIPTAERVMIEESISSSVNSTRLVASALAQPVALGMATLSLERYLADSSPTRPSAEATSPRTEPPVAS